MSDRRDDDFAAAMRDVRPLDESRRRSFRRRGRRLDRRPDRRPAPGFSIERAQSRTYGRREDTPEEVLDELRKGRPRPGNSLDLHGMTEEAARARVFRFVRQSRASGLACVALVHGRGLRSPAGAVLKRAVPEWLTQLPLARDVIAFSSAPPDRGGDGALWVLLAG